MTLPDDIANAFPPRPLDANKRSVGVVNIVGGSTRFLHAPVLAALGARAAGAGLIQLVVPDAARYAAGCHVPEATFTKLTATCVPPKADVTVIGMGLGVSSNTEALLSRLLSGSCGRFVLDADALTILANWYARTEGYRPAACQEVVLTPHEGEAARLLGVTPAEVAADRLASAKELARRYGAHVVLKGARTLVVAADVSRVYENATGNPFMALGGMGDLLSGVIGARWARLPTRAFEAAAASVWLHGAASDEIVRDGRDPSVVNTAGAVGAWRVRMERR